MRIALSCVTVLLAVCPLAAAGDNAVVIGTWEGESKCTVPNSPCHDEHVVYRISTDKKDPARLIADADKIVNGTPEFMGTLECQYHADQPRLSCTGSTARKDDWEFQVSGDTMTGTLTLEEQEQKILYRRVNLHRTGAKGK